MSETTDQRPGSSAEQKRARLAEILRKRDQSSGSNLSVVQERLWFLHAFDPVATTLTWVMRISGQLDQAALQQSLMDLVRRQESLRASRATAQALHPAPGVPRARPPPRPAGAAPRPAAAAPRTRSGRRAPPPCGGPSGKGSRPRSSCACLASRQPRRSGGRKDDGRRRCFGSGR